MPYTTDDVKALAQKQGITLRDGVDTDSAEVKGVAVSAYGSGPWEAEAEDTYRYDQLGQHSLLCTVAEEGGQIAGYIFYKIKGGDVYISDVAVGKAYQGRGIFDLLMAYALAYGSSQQALNATLYTTKGKGGTAMRKTYEKRGFKRKKIDYTTDDDEADTGSTSMKAPLNTALSHLENKLGN